MGLTNLNQKLNSLEVREVEEVRVVRGSQRGKIFIVVLIILLLLGLPLSGAAFFGKKAIDGGRQISAALKQENLGQVKDGVATTKSAVDGLNTSLNLLLWLKAIPVLGGYYSDVLHFTKAASYELQAAEIVVNTLMPYEEELGFTGGAGAGQDKIVQAVKVLNKVLPEINKIEPKLKKAKEEVEKVDSGKYPEEFKGFTLKAKIEEAKNLVIGVDIAVTDGKEALLLAPEILGSNTPKNYLLLFQNDKEIRPTGGFLTAYAFLRLDKGNLATTASDDIYRLDERLLKVCEKKICPLKPPAPLVKYLPEEDGELRTAWSMRDSNLSPDLPTAAAEFERMYEMLGNGIPFDGIITIDTKVVEELIKITGPLDVFGTTYSASQDERCSCPNVIYELEHYAEIASKGQEDRKAILGTMMQQMLAKILGLGTDKMLTVATTGVKLAGDKHIMLYMRDPKVQEALGKLNFIGEIKDFKGDYLHINDANFAGGKSNLYVDERVILDIKIDGQGNVKNKVTIEYKNPQAYSTWLNGILRTYIRVYTPLGAKLIESNGSDDPVNTLEDEGLKKTYFEAFLQVRPQNSRVISFEYSLPEKASGKTYPLLIQKQPGARDHHYVIKINGSTKAEFNLTSDKELNLSF